MAFNGSMTFNEFVGRSSPTNTSLQAAPNTTSEISTSSTSTAHSHAPATNVGLHHQGDSGFNGVPSDSPVHSQVDRASLYEILARRINELSDKCMEEEEENDEIEASGEYQPPLGGISVHDVIQKYGHDKDFQPSKNDKNFRSTDAPPGSAEKIEIMRRRVEAGMPLWHRDDRFGYDGLTGAVKPRE